MLMASLEKPLLGGDRPPQKMDPQPKLSKTVDPQPADEERDRTASQNTTPRVSPTLNKRSPILLQSQNSLASSCKPLSKKKVNDIKSATAIPLHRSSQNNGWQKLENLTQLREIKLISMKEYEERKQQLIDELTGTTIGEKASRRVRTTKPHKRRRKKAIKTETKASDTFPNPGSVGVTTVVPGDPPDWRLIKSEKAIKHRFNTETLKFDISTTEVKISKHPFARGALRLAYYMKECRTEDKTDDSWSALTGTKLLVAKISIDPFEEKDIYFQDVSMQALGQHFADKYNAYNPPKRVGFISSWVCQLVDRPMEIFCGVEQFIDGHYRKHNNNFGYVDEDERNTPQAFSHFTYQISKQQMLMCDIQGVCDLYTDPQIHTVEGVGYGKGNMAQKGIDQFMSTHRCNPICRYLKLKSINPKPDDLSGTLPNARFMSYKKVEIVTSISGNYQKPVLANTPLLPPRKKKSQHKREKEMAERKVRCSCCVIL